MLVRVRKCLRHHPARRSVLTRGDESLDDGSFLLAVRLDCANLNCPAVLPQASLPDCSQVAGPLGIASDCDEVSALAHRDGPRPGRPGLAWLSTTALSHRIAGQPRHR